MSVEYESPVGVPSQASNTPGTGAAFADPAVPLLVTKGEKKVAPADQDGFPYDGLAVTGP